MKAPYVIASNAIAFACGKFGKLWELRTLCISVDHPFESSKEKVCYEVDIS